MPSDLVCQADKVVVNVVGVNLAVDASVPFEILVLRRVGYFTPSVEHIQLEVFNPEFLFFLETENVVSVFGVARRDDIGEVKFPFAGGNDVFGHHFASLVKARHRVNSRVGDFQERGLVAGAPDVIVRRVGYGQDGMEMITEIFFRGKHLGFFFDHAQLERDRAVAAVFRREMAEISSFLGVVEAAHREVETFADDSVQNAAFYGQNIDC